jgi:hypothetical protein
MDLEKGYSSARTINDEFQKRSSDLRLMVCHMKDRADLARRIDSETTIPEHARDLAVKALSNELSENLSFFSHYLVNFINLGMQGLCHVDFETEFTFLGDGMVQTDRCTLYVDEERLEIPIEIGSRYIQTIFGSPDKQNPTFLEEFYKDKEVYYDRALGEVSGRCGLRIMEELFPQHCIHAVMKLPAHTLIENRTCLQ